MITSRIFWAILLTAAFLGSLALATGLATLIKWACETWGPAGLWVFSACVSAGLYGAALGGLWMRMRATRRAENSRTQTNTE